GFAVNPIRRWSSSKTCAITSTASASSPAMLATVPSAPTSTAASAKNNLLTTWTPSRTCNACLNYSGTAGTGSPTSRGSCTATGCGFSARRGRESSLLDACLQPTVTRLAVAFLQIDDQDAPVGRIADELDLAWVLALTVPAAVVLLLGELANRLAAELLEGAA